MSDVTVTVMSVEDARRLTERIRYSALSVRDGMEKLQGLVTQAQEGQAHVALGFKSWTAYLAETMGQEPLRLARDQRQELVGYLAGEGMSTRAIAPIVGADHVTVSRDIVASGVANATPGPTDSHDADARPAVAGVSFETPAAAPRAEAVSVGLDGKTYSRTVAAPPADLGQSTESRTPSRRPLADAARDAGQELRKATERLERLAADDRFARNKNEVAAHLRHHLARAIEVCTDLDRSINNNH